MIHTMHRILLRALSRKGPSQLTPTQVGKALDELGREPWTTSLLSIQLQQLKLINPDHDKQRAWGRMPFLPQGWDEPLFDNSLQGE